MDQNQKARVLFMRVIRFYKPDYLLMIGAFVFLALAVLCEVLIPLYTGKLIDILGAEYHWADFRSAILFMTLFSFGSSFGAGCRGGLFTCAIGSFIRRVKLQLFGSLVKQEIGFFEVTKTGDITSRLSTDTTLMGQAIARNVNVLLRTLINTIGMLYLMFSLSWKLTLLMLMEMPLTGLLQNIYDTHCQKLFKEVQDSMARANYAAGETMSGIRTVKSFNSEQSESRRYDDRLMDIHNLKSRRGTLRAVYRLVRKLVALGVKVGLLHYGRLFIQHGEMTTGSLFSFILYQGNLGRNIRTLIYMFGDMLNSVGAAGKVFEYLDRKPEVSSEGTLQPEELKGHVYFQKLNFSYPTRTDHNVLKDFSLELKPGQVTALVGISGGGKSTCVSLLQRFYQPQHGQILLDGKPLQDYQHKYLHNKIAVVGQEPVLFSGTVYDNIAYGLQDCSIEIVQEAARKANAHSFICELPKGYYTGTHLSLNGSDKLVRQWLESVVRWGSLHAALLLCEDAKGPVVRRWVLAHCFIGPVYETGRLTLFGNLALARTDMWVVGSVAAGLGCLFWETLVPDSNGEGSGKDQNQKARVLFMRVIRFYKPDYLLMIGGRSVPTGADFRSAIIFMTLFSFGSSFSAGCRGGLFMCAIGSFIRRVKLQLFGSLVKQEIGFFEVTKTGDITSRLSTDTTLMARAVALNVNVLLRTLIKTIGMLYLMFSLSWKLTLLMLMETPLTGLLQNIYDTHYQRLSKEVQDSIARANDAAGETVSGIRTVKSFNAEQSESHRYDDRLMDTHNLKTRRDTVRAVYLLVRRLVEVGVKVAMLHYGRLFIQYGQMTTGNLVSFILYQSDLADNIRTLIYIFGDMLNCVGAAGKVFEYLDRKPQVSTDGTLQPEELKGQVCFQKLNFFYPTRPEHNVLKDFSLELKPGQVTALVGISGGGKSTCVSLLQRFYQPQDGQILLDGQPLQNYQHKYLHSKIAVVGQEPVLFSGTVYDNIAYGLPNCSLERIKEAARKANAHDFICELQNGYDTDVGERGSLLGSSQKQRIAIARALVRQPQVLLLDEITSFLDAKSEQAVQEALANCTNQTLMVIAHRLKTIERADQIVVIDQGTVLEQGTHQELMERKGHYYTLKEKLFTEDNSDLN
ncbi:hypothetical protein NFI96_018102 [Prochilodus magdalenae]|nr:hypothetical protein NFI96_018102 [Prochilodus magdalenae]